MTGRRILTPAPAPALPEAEAEDATRRAVDVLARTIWGEARGEPLKGQEAVAAVVLNRVAVAKGQRYFWWGSTVETVCRKPWQFSCWNGTDPNRAKLQALRTGDLAFDTCLRIARRAVAGVLADQTRGATHYHTRAVEPSWAKGQAPTAEIGNHLFYRLEE